LKKSGGHREPYRELDTHKARMIERPALQNKRVGWTQRHADVKKQVHRFCEAMREINRRNGVGSSNVRNARRVQAAA
jgi:hypothetical protein